ALPRLIVVPLLEPRSTAARRACAPVSCSFTCCRLTCARARGLGSPPAPRLIPYERRPRPTTTATPSLIGKRTISPPDRSATTIIRVTPRGPASSSGLPQDGQRTEPSWSTRGQDVSRSGDAT